MPNVILTDSCFWLGLIDPADQHHATANTIATLIEGNFLLVPWPCLYEIIATRLTRRRKQLLQFEDIISNRGIIQFVDDSRYKIAALEQVFQLNRISGNAYSLADGVIREILKDTNQKIDYLVTFNKPDFQDLCDQRFIEIVDR